MNFHVLTLFPDMVRNGLETSITGRAIDKGLFGLDVVNNIFMWMMPPTVEALAWSCRQNPFIWPMRP